MGNPVVSMITVVFNNKDFIEGAMQSVLSQTYQNIEYIVIDGGSTDGTKEKIERYKDRVAKYVSEPDKGMYDALNKGISMATGEIIGMLHADDEYAYPDAVADMVKKMEHTGADVGWGDLVYVTRNNTDKIVRVWKSSEYREGLFKRGWHPPHPTLFVRKAIYDRYGGFRPDFKISADYELMLRFVERHRIKTCYLPKTMVKMRTGGKSSHGIGNIKNAIRHNSEDVKAWQVNGLKGGVRIRFVKPISKLIQLLKS